MRAAVSCAAVYLWAVCAHATSPVPPEQLTGKIIETGAEHITIRLDGPRHPKVGDSVRVQWTLPDGAVLGIGGGNVARVANGMAWARLTEGLLDVRAGMEAIILTYDRSVAATGDNHSGSGGGRAANLSDEQFLEALGRIVGPHQAFDEGVAYWTGQGVEQDYARAAESFGFAAKNGHVEAQGWYGYMLMKGLGVSVDTRGGLEWLTRAGKSGSAEAANHLGLAYHEGWGVPVDNTQACTWWRKAAALNHNWGLFNTGLCHASGWDTEVDFAQAAAYYRQAADMGLMQAVNSLGRLYQDGKGVPQDAAKAVEHYRMAAEAGHATAQNNLGWMHHIGLGVEQDEAEAIRWIRLAAENGSELAQNNLKLAAEEGWLGEVETEGPGNEEDKLDELAGLW